MIKWALTKRVSHDREAGTAMGKLGRADGCGACREEAGGDNKDKGGRRAAAAERLTWAGGARSCSRRSCKPTQQRARERTKK